MLGELVDEQVEQLLRRCTVGRIGCRDQDGIYVVPVAYVYADRSVYGHSAEGRKLAAMRAAPDVCFEVDDVHGLADWRSVVAQGRFEELRGPHAAGALDLLRRRFSPRSSTETGGGPLHGPGTGHPPVLFRVALRSWSGRFECAAPRWSTAPATAGVGSS